MGNNCCTPHSAGATSLDGPKKRQGRGITANKNINIAGTAGDEIIEEISKHQNDDEKLYISSSENFKTNSENADEYARQFAENYCNGNP